MWPKRRFARISLSIKKHTHRQQVNFGLGHSLFANLPHAAYPIWQLFVCLFVSLVLVVTVFAVAADVFALTAILSKQFNSIFISIKPVCEPNLSLIRRIIFYVI